MDQFKCANCGSSSRHFVDAKGNSAAIETEFVKCDHCASFYHMKRAPERKRFMRSPAPAQIHYTPLVVNRQDNSSMDLFLLYMLMHPGHTASAGESSFNPGRDESRSEPVHYDRAPETPSYVSDTPSYVSSSEGSSYDSGGSSYDSGSSSSDGGGGGGGDS